MFPSQPTPFADVLTAILPDLNASFPATAVREIVRPGGDPWMEDVALTVE
jgi:chorismate mutase